MSDEHDDLHPESSEPALDAAREAEVPTAEPEVPSGSESPREDEGEELLASKENTEAGAEEAVTGTEPEASPEDESRPVAEEEDEPEFNPKPRPPAKLERLQKILAQAGVASRRKAEELIEQGRVQVNGKVVTELGTKADAGRDHIRVDGKLLQGAERLRYFVLNKPKGFVTTVKDPEGRPTVMQFFEKMRERLYPVGRLDYMSEGLLLVTNDGELANRLTRASSGVEKTYLVKVAGQPTEAELEILRSGVAIDRGKPGTERVRTSPARIRQVRQGDNPWYEVVLVEGRNRELRKMFEEIGHFVEKIRRVGYGPLVLDQEPGNLRELEPEELEALRKAAEGNLRTPKSKAVRRQNAADAAHLPTVAPRPSRPRAPKPPETRFAAGEFGENRPKRSFGEDKPYRPAHPSGGRSEDRPRRPGAGPAKFGPSRPTGRPAARPAWQKDDRPTRPPARSDQGAAGEPRPGRSYGNKPPAGRTYGDKPAGGRTYGARPAQNKWGKPGKSDRPAMNRPPAPRRTPDRDNDLGPVRPPNLRIEEIRQSDRPTSSRPGGPRSYSDRPGSGRPRPSRPSSERPASSRPGSNRPFSSEGGLPRPYTTSSGKPRAGGARPSSKPGKPAGRSYDSGSGPGFGFRTIDPRTGSSYRPAPGGKRSYDGPPSGPRPSRPYTPRPEGEFGSRPRGGSKFAGTGPSSPRGSGKSGSGWKPRPSFGGPGKPAPGARSRPKAGRPSKPGSKGKSSGRKRSL
jgi:23S rRNA pseudouridine2605 synthase